MKFQKDLVCHPCHHGKMIATSHPPVNQVMTAHPGELLHMDTVGPSRVMSVGGEVVRSCDCGRLFSLFLGLFHENQG